MLDDTTVPQGVTDSAPNDTPPDAASDAPTWDNLPENPPAEAVPLEEPAAPQLEAAEPVARESESQEAAEPEKEEPKPEEDHEEGDTPEIQALPTPAAKKWARRQFQDAQLQRTYLDFSKPIEEFGAELFNRSRSRYTEHVNDILKNHADYAAQYLFGTKYEDAKSRLTTNGQPSTTTTSEVAFQLPTVEELDTLSNEQVIERFKQLEAVKQSTQSKEAAELRTQLDNLQKQFDAVSGKITNQEQRDRETQVMQIQNELYSDVWKVVDEVIDESGLKVKPDDPPKIANLKRAVIKILNNETEPTFDESEDNRKVVEYVVSAAKRLERDNAFREKDNLKVRARAAASKVLQTPEVKELVDQITAYAKQSTAKSRATNPAPPVPGAAGGFTIKQPTTWDEAIAGSSAAA